MEGYDQAVQLCTALDSQPQDTLRLIFPRFADADGVQCHISSMPASLTILPIPILWIKHMAIARRRYGWLSTEMKVKALNARL
jgi:hypothetical protein